MKKLITGILLCGLLCLTGCDEDAQEYAKQLNEVLKSYQVQVLKKNKAEQEAYRSLAAFYANAQDEELFFNLELERNERVRKLADDYASGQTGAPTNSTLRALLKDYGNYDFEQTRASLEEESSVATRYLANLESLEIETAKIESLSKILKGLSKPKKRLRELEEIANFAVKIDAEFQKLACDDLARKIKCLGKAAAAESNETKKAGMAAEILRLNDELKERKDAGQCSSSVDSVKCPD